MTNFTCNLAIAIGINNYRNNIAELKTARPDAEKLANLLGTDYNYQVELLTDNTPLKPTLKELRTLLTQWLPQQLQLPAHNNRLLFYFAGHGMSLESDDGPKGFLLPQDANPKDPSTFLPMQELHDALIALPCHHLLIILDCCFAGTFRWSSTRKSIPIPETIHRQHYDRFLRYPACQVITSSAHNQEALDFLSDKRGTGKDAQHSPFAEALFEALQDGKPDEKGKRYKKADLTKDGVVTAPELYLYLRDNVETRSGERQTPGLFPLKKHDRGEYIFHDPNFDPTTLSEAPALDEANNPYRGLKPFEEQHARFFFGRQELIKHLYTRIAAPDRSLTVVLGISGSGKSSLVKAGLIPYLRQRSQPEDFAIHLAQACILTTAILYSFARLPRKSWFPPNFLPIDYSHQWQILSPMRPGESPFASLARTLLAIADTPVSPQLNQLDFLNELLQREDEQLNAEMEQVVSEGKWNSSRAKQLEQKTETLTRIIADWNDASPLVRQRLLVEHFEMFYALCQSGEQESKQQRQLKQTFLDCLAPLTQQLQSDPESLVTIAHAWEQNHPDTKLLLVIDQFEELITLGRTTPQDSQNGQPEEWHQFLSLLETTLAANVLQLRILITLRSDFEPRFLSSEILKPYWSKARFPVRAMRSDELRQTIEGPASEMALYFEPANLVDRLIDEVGQMPGALPLLSFTLSELYVRLYDQWAKDKATDRALTIDAQFDQEGGVAGSLTRRANEEYQKIGDDPNLSEAGHRTMRRVMLRMLTLEGGETARRRVPDSELIYPTQEESDRVTQVVDRLVIARLLIRGQLETGEPYVEPAHDFLIRGWGILQDWINEEKAKETLELQQRLTAQANDWARNQGPLLPDGDRLNRLEGMLKQPDIQLNHRETEFIQRSVFYRDLQQKQERELRTRVVLREKATRAANLTHLAPLDSLTLAIQASGKNLDELPHEILSEVQISLNKAMNEARVPNTFQGHEAQVTAIAFSPDGKIIASGSSDKTIRLWNLQGNPISEPLNGHEAQITTIAFSPDGKIIASGSSDKTIRLWNLQGNPIGKPFDGHEAQVTAIAFSPDGKIIASGSSDKTIRLWNLQENPTGELLSTTEVGEVLLLAFDPDSGQIISCHDPWLLCIWDFEGNLLRQHQVVQGSGFTSAAFSPNRQILVTCEHDCKIRLWDMQGALIGQPFTGHNHHITSISFSSDGESILSGSRDQKILLWDLQGNILRPPLKHQEQICFVALSPDNQNILSCEYDGKIHIWDWHNNSVSKPFIGHKFSINTVTFSPNRKMIVSGSDDQTIGFWNYQGNLIKQMLQHEAKIQTVSVSPDEQMIASGSTDGSISLWDFDGNRIAHVWQGHEDTVQSIAFSSDSQLIASGSRDCSIRLWDLKGKQIGEPFVLEEFIYSVSCSPTDPLIASGSSDSKIHLWDFLGNHIGAPFQGHDGVVSCIAFSPDGRWIVSSSMDTTLRLWDLEGNPVGQPFRGHEGDVLSVAFSPDAQVIASCGSDLTVRLWNLEGKPICEPMRGHKKATNLPSWSSVGSLAFSRDGEMIVSAGRGEDKTLRLWRANWRSWLQICCDRLRYHPVFTNPESIEDPEQREIAIAACETCEKYVWSKAENSDE